MPEGPEVLTIVDQLDFYLNKKAIKSFEFTSGRYEDDSPSNFDMFINSLPLTINQVFCKGKMIVFELSKTDGSIWWIFNSLRMTGKWNFKDDKEHRKVHIKFFPREENGVLDIEELFYIDVRCMGTFEFINKESEKDNRLNELANGFIGKKEYIIDYNTFYKNVKNGKKASFTTKLTDQKSICSGIGNYLLSEIMYASGLHPTIKCNELSDNDIKRVFNKCSEIIKLSYELGGMSMRDYVDLHGDEGLFEKELKVYGKRGKTDPYGNAVMYMKRGNGQTIWYVPGLQRKRNSSKDEIQIEIESE